jgi:hypothetical protein
MATKTNLVIDQGSNFSATIAILDAAGQPFNLTYYTGESQIRKHYTSLTSTSFNVELGGANGTVLLSMSSNTTANIAAGRYVYDVEITGGESNTVTRVVEGIVTVTPNVTR